MNNEEIKKHEKGELSIGVMQGSAIETLRDRVAQVCSLDLTIKANQITLYNAMQKCDVRLIDIKGQDLTIVGMYIDRTDFVERDESGNDVVNPETGEVHKKPKFKTILFGDDGKTYVSTAYGIFNSLRTIVNIFGMPSSENPIRVRVMSKTSSSGKGESLILLVVNE